VDYELASRRFSKTWFDTKNDWPSHPPSTYECPRCSAHTNVTRADLESAFDRRSEPTAQALLQQLRYACGWVWGDQINAICSFNCSGCGRMIVLGFQVSDLSRTGHLYRLAIVGENLEPDVAS